MKLLFERPVLLEERTVFKVGAFLILAVSSSFELGFGMSWSLIIGGILSLGDSIAAYNIAYLTLFFIYALYAIKSFLSVVN